MSSSESLKDESVKEDAVTNRPGYIFRQVLESDEFVLIASDGIFDVLSSAEAITFAQIITLGKRDIAGCHSEAYGRFAIRRVPTTTAQLSSLISKYEPT